MSEAVAKLNRLPREKAEQVLLQCCGSRKWARGMVLARPFQDAGELMLAADHVWWSLEALDWLEAFSAHPKIGERKAAAKPSAASRWSEAEQAGARSAAEETLAALAKANRDYERRFGYIYIVCATGKSAEEMLELAQARLQNEPGTELRIAAEEQRRITRLRLEKLLSDLQGGAA